MPTETRPPAERPRNSASQDEITRCVGFDELAAWSRFRRNVRSTQALRDFDSRVCSSYAEPGVIEQRRRSKPLDRLEFVGPFNRPANKYYYWTMGVLTDEAFSDMCSELTGALDSPIPRVGSLSSLCSHLHTKLAMNSIEPRRCSDRSLPPPFRSMPRGIPQRSMPKVRSCQVDTWYVSGRFKLLPTQSVGMPSSTVCASLGPQSRGAIVGIVKAGKNHS